MMLAEALANQLAIAIDNARLIAELERAQERLREENCYLREEVTQESRFDTLIGDSPAMHEVYQLIDPILTTTTTVLP
jgi:transcriptional regulator with GAF, ATPase, and Fis domain